MSGKLTLDDLPVMNSAAYSNTTYTGAVGAGRWADVLAAGDAQSDLSALAEQMREFRPDGKPGWPNVFGSVKPKQEKQEMADKRRLVQIFIVDPHEAVPLDKAMVYQGEQFLTDLTDQELFYELPIKELLEKHNVKRTAIVDKSVKSRTEKLEPARVRDLTMTVTVIAAF